MDSTLTNTHDKKEETPVIRHESNGVKITITFTEKTGEGNVKERILDVLTGAYEKRIRGDGNTI